jgi:hypothetical protein
VLKAWPKAAHRSGRTRRDAYDAKGHRPADARFAEAKTNIETALERDAEGARGAARLATERSEKAVAIEPDKGSAMAFLLIAVAHEEDSGLDMLELVFKRRLADVVNWVHGDADLDSVRDEPRFKAMLAAAEARIAQPP